MKVPAKDKEAEKKYSYNQLVDLHDKLTLVVGKPEDHQKIIRYCEDVILKFNCKIRSKNEETISPEKLKNIITNSKMVS